MTDALVIGGGFAGLSAAAALAGSGVRVTVLEARPALGGRATAFTDPATGERVDNGQHVLIGCYHETFAFLRRIGAEAGVELQSNLEVRIVDRAGGSSTLACPPLPAPWHLIAGVLRWRALTARDRLAILRMGRALAGRVDGGHTVRQWLLQHHQTPRLIELLWEPLALAALNQPIDVAGAASFREVLRRMFSRDRRDSTLGLPLVPLDELYAGPARDFIDAHGGNVEMGAPARIVADAGGPGLAIHVKDRELRARAIVCAVPWHALPDVLPPVPALDGVIAAARDTAPSPIVTVNLWFDRPVTTGAFVGLPGRHMQWVFDKRRLLGDGTSHLSLVSSGADAIAARSNAELIDLAMTELAGALPRVAEAVLRRAVVVREKRATFSLAPGAPARPGTRTPVAGLFLAGDWIDTGLPGTIESAVVSGHRAAEAVMQFVK